MSDDTNSESRTLTIVRVFDAPARLLFKAHAEREHIMQWFGPVGWPVTFCEMDFRVGGQWRMAMTGSTGVQNPPFGGTYLAIEPDRLIKWDNGFEIPGAERMVTTIAFDELDGKTTVTMTTVFASQRMYAEHVGAGFEQGVGSGMDQLERIVAKMAT
jgi:uncharacterized protein YndB with AHSA1/START domain